MNFRNFHEGAKLELEIHDNMGDLIEPGFASEYEWTEDQDTALIAAPIFEGNIYPVRIGSIMNVYCYDNSEVYHFKARVNGKDSTGNVALLRIKLEGEIEKIQRRQYFRFECSVPFKYRMLSEDNSENNDAETFQKTFTRDISGGGLCILATDSAELDQLLECELYIAEENPVKFTGKILRVSNVEMNSIFKYELGIAFEAIADKDREAIIGYIFTEQRKMRKKGLI